MLQYRIGRMKNFLLGKAGSVVLEMEKNKKIVVSDLYKIELLVHR